MKNLNCSAEALFLNAANIIKPTGIFYVGAYDGGELEIFKDYNCPVYAFEPNPGHFHKIVERYNKHNIPGKAYQAGCANFNGVLPLNIPDRDMIASSFLKTKTITDMFPHMSLKNTVMAEIVTIDSLEIRDANYLILDIQGCEVNAILGAYDTIMDSVDVIITEYSTVELYSCQNQVEDLNALLTELGFYTMSDLTHIHADAIYLKNKFKNVTKDLNLITHPIVSNTGSGLTTHDFGYNSEWLKTY
jgi:FkbM family methyltransferase